MKNKFGSYIQKLMTTIIDKDQEDFVKDLAFDELKRLNINIEEFLRNNIDKEFEEKQENEKQLLQEENKNGKNWSRITR